MAYVVAHEAAHAVSAEYGLWGRGATKDYELGADCAAGMWANSMYWRGAIHI